MQLDQTRIAIRERGFGEIMGLALQVMRYGIGWWSILWVMGCVPFFLLNWALLHELLVEEMNYEEVTMGYWMALLWMVSIETPLATSLITIYLGKMMFASEYRFRDILVDFFRSLPQLILFQVLLRTILLPILLLPYWVMPYFGELILLERNPLFAGKKGQLTTSRRSRNLHTNNGGELFGRWILSVIVGVVLVFAFAIGLETLLTQLGGIDVDSYMRQAILFPIALWIVVGWMAVVRFLSYLDLRIRREGWEVELLMRAEAARLRRQSALVS